MAKILEFPAERIMKGTHAYYPEMKERKPNCQMEARLSHYGKHYFVDTPIELKGRGIEFLKTYRAEDFVRPSHRVGWNSYKVTVNAYRKLEEQYSISREVMLD